MAVLLGHRNERNVVGWRMASTAMRLLILAACAGTFYVLISGRHFKPPAALIIFETQGYAPPAPACRVAAGVRGRRGWATMPDPHDVDGLQHV